LICNATSGYDGPTGVGTPDGITAFKPISEAVKRANEEKRQAEAEAAAKANTQSAGSGTGTSGSAGTNQPGASGAGKAAAPSTVSGTATIKLTAFALTPTALLALNHPRSKISSVAFAFTLSAAARVRATLAKLVRVHGHNRWITVRGALTFSASRGRNQRRLTNRDALTSGRYRLTLAPQGGAARALTFQVG
jgi:hypothetical protein